MIKESLGKILGFLAVVYLGGMFLVSFTILLLRSSLSVYAFFLVSWFLLAVFFLGIFLFAVWIRGSDLAGGSGAFHFHAYDLEKND